MVSILMISIAVVLLTATAYASPVTDLEVASGLGSGGFRRGFGLNGAGLGDLELDRIGVGAKALGRLRNILRNDLDDERSSGQRDLRGLGAIGLRGLRGFDRDGDFEDDDRLQRFGLNGVGLSGASLNGLGLGIDDLSVDDNGDFAWGYNQPKNRGRVDVARLGHGKEITRIITRVGTKF